MDGADEGQEVGGLSRCMATRAGDMRVEAGRGFIRAADSSLPLPACPVSAHLGPGIDEADPILIDGN